MDRGSCTHCFHAYSEHAEAHGLVTPSYVSNCRWANEGKQEGCPVCPGRCWGPHPYSPQDPRGLAISSFTGCYAFLSDHYPAPVGIYDRVYLTVTHAFCAALCAQERDRDVFREPWLADPGQAREHSIKLSRRSDGAEVYDALHRFLLFDKFTRNSLLKDLLLATGTRLLVGDPSVEPAGLGDRLMAVREALWTPPF